VEGMSTADARSIEFVLTTAMFRGAANPVVLCDGALAIVAVNDAAAALLGMPAGQLIGKPADEVLARGLVAGLHPPVTASGHLEWRCELHPPGGERRVLEVSGTFLEERERGVQGWALALKDIGQVEEPPHFVARSAAAQELLEFVSRIAASRATSILLSGESGTGKELIAKRLHCLSSRAGAPFVPINCAALPATLLESELFGYEKGAFTGAWESRKGLLEIAHGGTVFLDEIGELTPPLQAKLLRVLENQTFRRVGGSRDLSVDLRIIGATNADLDKAIEDRTFRSDLYYRLNVIQIRLPALRERPEDIQELAIHFLGHFNRVHHRRIRGIHPGTQRLLALHSWPGNVRELRNIMERAVLVETSSMIMTDSLAIPKRASSARPVEAERTLPVAPLSLRSSERELIAAALAEASGNQTRAAGLLGIGRFSLRYKMKKLGMLEPPARAEVGIAPCP